MVTADHIRPEHIRVFIAAAKVHRVYIAVRRTNPASLQYMGKPGYAPKLLDCKGKTAQFNARIGGREYQTAGLVVDFDLIGAFCFSAEKMPGAAEAWRQFAASGKLAPRGLVYKPDYTLTYENWSSETADKNISKTSTYYVQMDPKHDHYGCLMHAMGHASKRYIHGDYDLFAVVPADNPSENVFVQEKRLGEKHSRSPKLLEVQTFLNANMGTNMVTHGEQDTYKNDPNDQLDVFFPDGTVKSYLGRLSVQRLYETVFQGRLMGGGETVPSGGEWRRPT